ncbi:MAG: UvrD-helicase domain-containing protein [Myxococcota bacterium]
METHPILSGLNPEQRRAVEKIDGPLLVLAGAGSGKTRVLTHRIAWMLYKGIPPWQILAVTFTNKAAGEMKERVAELVGSEAKKILVSTFHSACVRFLRRDIAPLGYKTSFTIYDSDDQLRLLRDIVKAMNLDPKVHSPRSFRAYIDGAKNRMARPDMDAAARGDLQEKVFEAYERQLREADAVDFNDLIGLVVKLWREHPEVLEKYQNRYRYLMVDEYQDTNKAQYRLIKLLAGRYRNLAVVGDDDQSIYAFRGADVTNILSFEKDFPETGTIRLERNYRSTQTILTVAGAVVSNNQTRMAKTMWTEAGDGPKVGVIVAGDEDREAGLVVQRIQRMIHDGRDPGDFAIIYRSNAASRAFEQSLLQARIDHVLVGAQKFYERREIRDIISYLKLVLNPADDMAFLRVINTPPRGIGAKSVTGIVEEAQIRGVPLLQSARGWSMRGRGKARTSAGAFCQLIDALTEDALHMEPADLVRKIAQRSGYIARLESQNTREAQGRLENIQELIAALENADDTDQEDAVVSVSASAVSASAAVSPDESPMDRLQRFLDQISLASPTEDIPGEDKGQVTLLTAHLAKGLEFPVVFVVGMYEGGFPHFRSLDRNEDIEEERRLVYVAFTRAKQKLFVTRPRERLMFTGGSASRQEVEPSRFFQEMPQELMDFSQAGRSFMRRSSSSASNRSARMQRLGFKPPSASTLRRRAAPGLFSKGASAPAGRRQSSPLPQSAAQSLVAASDPLEEVRTMSPEGPEDFEPGTRVLHPKFGIGTIRRRDGAPNNPKLQIQFDRFGSKSILARYANLEIVLT